MNARTSLFTSLAIAAGLGLAGCGGSSDNNGDETNPPAKPSSPTTHDPITVPASADLAVNADGSGTSNIKAGESRKAPGGGTLACASADCALAIVRDAGDGSFTVTSTGGTVTYTPEAEPEVSGAGAVALRGELLDVEDGSAGEGDEPDPADLSGFTNNAAALGVAGFPTSGAELSDPKDFDSGDAPVALQGWKGERWTNDGQTIVRYTDQNIETKTDGTFASRFGDREAGGGDNITNTTASGEQGGGLDWKHAESADFPGASKSQSYVDGASFAGTFAGVDGKFSCAGNACELNRDKDGKLGDGIARGEGEDGDSENNVWTFTADDENAAVEYKDQDADYLAFGWWRDTSTGGTAIEDFKVLYSGRAAQRSGLDAVTGKATYNGHAAGNYVKGTEGGEFVADAKLEATFGGTPDNDAITGTISNFRDSSDEILGKWEVIAKAANSGDADIAGAGTFSINDPTGGAGGENWADGQMDGTFYGGTGAAHPTGVAGWFHATTNDNPGTGTGETPWAEDDVAVAGAFAATRHNRADVAAE